MIFFSISSTTFAGYDYIKTNQLINESVRLAEEEKYDISLSLLESAENRFLTKKFNILKTDIENERESQEKMAKDKKVIDDVSSSINADFFETNYEEIISELSVIPEDSKYNNEAKLKIEEVKRLKLEDELGIEKASRIIAELEAEAEKTAKQAALVQAAQKERVIVAKNVEEKRLGTDNDGDGLSTREEEKLGTSDYDKDSDDDGINDGEDINPTGGGRMMPQNFVWSYGGFTWDDTRSISEDWYDYYKGKSRELTGSIDDIHGLQFVTSEDPFIQEMGNAVKNAALQNGLNESALALSFVQSLSYVEDSFIGYDEYPKYPVETFFEKNGDCEDTSYLAASIIDAMDIGSAIIILPGHMAVGVWMDCETPGYSYNVRDRCYYYAETTSEGYGLGDIPPDYVNTMATVVEIESGNKTQAYPTQVRSCVANSDITGYYNDGVSYYTDLNCTREITCMQYKGYFTDGYDLYHNAYNSKCVNVVTAGCYASDSHAGKFYTGGYWYDDSKCISIYKSMSCTYPYYGYYSCTTESDYNTLYISYVNSGSLRYSSEMTSASLDACREDINEYNTYQQELSDYNKCVDMKEY